MIQSLYDCFKHWASRGSVYIVSDTHFDDPDCRYMNPNWPDPKEHLKIIKGSMKFRKNCTLIHLGDVGDPKYLKQLEMWHTVLITGNHDAGASKYKDYFNEIYTGPLMIADKLILSHEPVDTPWAFNIHGHCHSSPSRDSHHLNVCADVVDYQAVNLGELIKRGLLTDITHIHRMTIDNAAWRKENE